MNICVVALGKIGLPLAVQFAAKGHKVIGADVNEKVVELVNAGTEPFPGEHDLDVSSRRPSAPGLLSATTDTAAAVAAVRRRRGRRPAVRGRRGRAGLRLDGLRDQGDRRGPQARHARLLRDHPAGRHHPHPLGADAGARAPASPPGEDFHLVFSPERVLTGRVFADLRRYPKLVGGIDEASAQRGVEFYEAVLDFDERADLRAPERRLGPRHRGGLRAGQARRDHLPRRQHRPGEPVRPLRRQERHRRQEGHRGLQLASRTATSTSPASPSAATASRSTRGCTCGTTRRPPSCARRARRTPPCPSTPSTCWPPPTATWTGVGVLVLGAAYRGGVKETAFSGVFPTVEALKARGAVPFVSDPMYTAEELTAHGLTPHEGQTVTAAILQADHAEYRELAAADLPDVRVLVDGRRTTDPARWEGVRRVVIGG